jgi:hypothetical protein
VRSNELFLILWAGETTHVKSMSLSLSHFKATVPDMYQTTKHPVGGQLIVHTNFNVFHRLFDIPNKLILAVYVSREFIFLRKTGL